LAEGEFAALGGGGEDVATSRLASGSFPGTFAATFPVLTLIGREVCDAGCGDGMAALGTCDADDEGGVELGGRICDAGCDIAGLTV
jgi:hypothetical protein